jgi:hypothetical protein
MTAKPAVDEIQLSRVLFLLALSVFISAHRQCGVYQ